MNIDPDLEASTHCCSIVSPSVRLSVSHNIRKCLRVIASERRMEGEYTGDTQEGVPHGSGRMVYRDDDHLDR